ncbi:hypothetical protein N7449_002112 [Penicillium cf. viridicatum]|uniref:Uncharacterized protein n=1 Tax=Penicillium cf. viridicatum TaxID=2972119 RepID=A0A9W9MUH6_9EURO|nr:hypothetical protein N7449_002112 [Penicillium cf. viridicatum]
MSHETNFFFCLKIAAGNIAGNVLKLHPRKEFSQASLQYPARGRSCTKYAGIVDLCPCAAWTIRERSRIVKLLKSRTAKLAQVQIGPFKFDRTGGPHLSHSCSLVTTPNRNARVEMRIFIDKSDHLVVHARYTIHLSTRLARASAEPIVSCPHVDLNSLIYSNSPNRGCPQCRTLIDRDSTLSQDKEIAVFDVKRDLGSCKWPADSRWLSNCRITGDEFSQNIKFWSSSRHLKETRANYYGWDQEYEEDQRLLQEEYARIQLYQERLRREAISNR